MKMPPLDLTLLLAFSLAGCASSEDNTKDKQIHDTQDTQDTSDTGYDTDLWDTGIDFSVPLL
jgi:hypothetical protein